jgi:hypothetical protein
MRNRIADGLRAFTDAAEFNRLCSQLLARTDYPGITPHNIQGPDGAADAHQISPHGVIVFHYSLRDDWKPKLLEDLEFTKERGLAGVKQVVFVSSQDVQYGTYPELRRELERKYGWEVDVKGQEWFVDHVPRFPDLAKKYFDLDVEAVAPKERWAAVLTQTARTARQIRDTIGGQHVDRPEITRVVESARMRAHTLVLGEAGAGKSVIARAVCDPPPV